MLDYLRCEVSRCADSCWYQLIRILDNFAHAEISNLNFPILSHENVLKFQISMDDPFLM